MTNPKALKELATALEIDVADVPDKNVAVLNAIAENYQGEGSAETIPEALENIAAVADNIGSKPEGSISITANGNDIDVAQYATADVNVPNPSTGQLNVSTNGTYDVTEKASVKVTVPGNTYGTITIVNNASRPLTFKSFSNDTIAGYYYPLGYENKTVAANGGQASVNALLEFELTENKYKINCILDFTGYATLNLTATANSSGTTVNLAKIRNGRWALEVITTRGNLSVTDTITIAEATT